MRLAGECRLRAHVPDVSGYGRTGNLWPNIRIQNIPLLHASILYFSTYCAYDFSSDYSAYSDISNWIDYYSSAGEVCHPWCNLGSQILIHKAMIESKTSSKMVWISILFVQVICWTC